jgi:hypothetical protein
MNDPLYPPREVERLREEFGRNDCAALRGFLAPEIGEAVKKQILHIPFDLDRFYVDGVLVGLDEHSFQPPYPFLDFMMNGPAILRLVESISGCRGLEWFDGRIYRMVPSEGHFLEWHDDRGSGGLVGMSLNLSPSPYEGGVFQIRDRAAARAPREAPIPRFGDAILFRIRADLEHRLTPLTGARPKFAYAGWFGSGAERPMAGTRPKLAYPQ